MSKRITIAFTLSMPGNNSWNGRWSGDGKPYVVLRSFTGRGNVERTDKILAHMSYGYDFGDGWRASVAVRRVDADEARQLRKNSAGFCGYDWMIDEIVDHGCITPLVPIEKVAT